MSITRYPVFTIGHSTQTLEAFIELLQYHQIDVVADARSLPYSRVAPQFNQGSLKLALRRHGIRYVFLGKELGGRPDDLSCYENAQVQYERVARTDLFKRGIERILQDANERRLAIVCTEKEPLECHRTLLVARELHGRGVKVCHILDNKRIQTHEETMDRLLDRLGMRQGDLFGSHASSRDEMLADAVARQASKIAWSRDKLVTEERT